MNYYSGQNYNIVPRLQREGRNTELSLIQFETQDSIDGKDGYIPMAKEEFWPICPSVGDTFTMESFFSGKTNKPNKYINWKVIHRDIMFSGPSAHTMAGIVLLIVKNINDESNKS